MGRYRYRTDVLLGPWRAELAEAEAEAVRAGQAYRNVIGGPLYWRVSGRIERESGSRPSSPDAD